MRTAKQQFYSAIARIYPKGTLTIIIITTLHFLACKCPRRFKVPPMNMVLHGVQSVRHSNHAFSFRNAWRSSITSSCSSCDLSSSVLADRSCDCRSCFLVLGNFLHILDASHRSLHLGIRSLARLQLLQNVQFSLSRALSSSARCPSHLQHAR